MTQTKRIKIIATIRKAGWLAMMLFLLSACGPSESEQQATITQIALDVFSTQTALAPTASSTITQTATVTATSTHTPSPLPTETLVPSPTQEPDLVVLDLKITMREGYDSGAYALVAYLFEGDTPEVIGRDESCEHIKVVDRKGNIGWVDNSKETIDLRIRCELLPLGSFRPFHGKILLDNRPSTGLGEFEVQNGLSIDGVILLADAEDKPIVAFYSRGGETFTLDEIPDGPYWVFFSTGEEWIGGENRFTENVRRQKFEDSFLFNSSGSQYTIWSITLHAVAGGQAETESISEDEFPSLSE